MDLITHVIDGEDVESAGGARFPTVDPWTQQAHADVALGGAAEADRAVAAARRAFDTGPWPRMGFAERGRLLHRLADLIDEHAHELALADHRHGQADQRRAGQGRAAHGVQLPVLRRPRPPRHG